MACKNQTAIRYRLWIMQKIARAMQCEQWNWPKETYGRRDMNSAFCHGMVTTTTIAHHFMLRNLYVKMQASWSHLMKRELWACCDKRKGLNGSSSQNLILFSCKGSDEVVSCSCKGSDEVVGCWWESFQFQSIFSVIVNMISYSQKLCTWHMFDDI